MESKATPSNSLLVLWGLRNATYFSGHATLGNHHYKGSDQATMRIYSNTNSDHIS